MCTADRLVTITNSNQSPTIATNTGDTVLEGSTANVITTAMLNEGDPDDDGAELTYTITSNVANGTLRLNGSAIGLNDTLTQADIDAGLLTYDHNGGETTSDTFGFSLADGGENGSTPATGTFNITVSPVNDAPVNVLPGAQVTPVSTPVTLSGSNAIQVSDVDAASSSIRVTLTATNGTMTLASTTGLAFTTGDGTADGTIVVTGTVSDLNTALDGLTFSPTAAFNGTGTITVLTEDLGNTGSGGALSDSDVLNIQIGAARFQQGVDGYTGTEDTYVAANNPTTSYGNATSIITDDAGSVEQGLIRFDNLFGSGPGQVPLGSTITNATLSVYVTDADSNDFIDLHRMNATW